MDTDQQPAPVDLVLEGGGVKGIALTAAVRTLVGSGYAVRRVAGTSGGAIVGSILAALVRAGESIERLDDIAQSLDYTRFRDRGPVGGAMARVGLGPLVNVFAIGFRSGIYTGKYLQDWLTGVLGDLGVRTFADLRLPEDPESDLPADRRYGLVVMVSDVSRRRLVRLPWDYPTYGLNPDEQSVAAAVRASGSIPFYFRPVALRAAQSFGSSTFVDGGMLSNYPITAFDRTDGRPPRWPTIGVRLSPRELGPPPTAAVGSSVSLAFAVAGTMMQASDAVHVHDSCNVARSIFVDTGTITAVDFDITAEQRDDLLAAGTRAADEFLRTWDFQRWLSTCRAGDGGSNVPGAEMEG